MQLQNELPTVVVIALLFACVLLRGRPDRGSRLMGLESDPHDAEAMICRSLAVVVCVSVHRRGGLTCVVVARGERGANGVGRD